MRVLETCPNMTKKILGRVCGNGLVNRVFLPSARVFLPSDCVLLSLVTVGLFRKYISFLELPLSWLLPSHLCCVIGTQGYKRAKVSLSLLEAPFNTLLMSFKGAVSYSTEVFHRTLLIGIQETGRKESKVSICPKFLFFLFFFVSGRHDVSSLTAAVVSVPLHRLLPVHVHKHIPTDSTGTEEPEVLLKFYSLTNFVCFINLYEYL